MEAKISWDDIDVLKVAHHGSRYSSSKDFLNATKPEISIISCGKDNDYGHPHKETMDRYNKLGANFTPTDITTIKKEFSNEEQKLSKVAAEAFEKMCTDAKKEGLYIIANSAYRSYDEQKKIYDYYYKKYGKTYVDEYVSLPGYSEQQTGLAVDIGTKKETKLKNTKEYKWIIKNAHKYGFIIRYPKNKENITGYSSEDWHIRYVGKDIAKYIYQNKISFEEYYAMYLYR